MDHIVKRERRDHRNPTEQTVTREHATTTLVSAVRDYVAISETGR